MSKPIKKSEFRKGLDSLWNKVKTNSILDITLDKTQGKNALKKQKSSQVSEEIVPHIVTRWNDLENTSETYTFLNLMSHKDTMVIKNTGPIESNGDIGTGTNWTRVYVPVESGKTYYIYNKRCETNNTVQNIIGSSRFTYFNTSDETFDNSTYADGASISGTITAGNKTVISVLRTTRDITHLGFSIYQLNPDYDVELMVWESSQTPSDLVYVKDNIIDKTFINGEEVIINFNNSNTNLQSDNVKDSIRELDGKHSNYESRLTRVESKATDHDGTLQQISQTVVSQGGSIGDLQGRVSSLEAKPHPHTIGEMMVLFYNPGDSFTIGNTEYLYCGRTRTVSGNVYPQLQQVLNKQGNVMFYIPQVNDIPDTTTSTTRYHYICAKIG